MPFDTLTPQQQAFIETYLSGSFFSRNKDKKTVKAYEAYVAKEAEFKVLAARIPSSHPAMQAILGDLRGALDLKKAGKFEDATAALVPLISRAEALEGQLKAERKEMLDKAGLLQLASGASEGDIALFTGARDAVVAALPDETPTVAQLALAKSRLERAAALVPQINRMSALAKKNPKAAAAAHVAFKEFAKVTGGDVPTEETIKEAGDALTAARTAAGRADEAVKLAQAMPSDTKEAIAAREEAIKAALKTVDDAKAVLKDAQDREKALVGTKLLTAAMDSGPLSGHTGRPFKDTVAEQFIQGFQKDPRLTAAAVQAAEGSRHPDAVAAALSSVSDKVAAGFADGEGNALPETVDPREYAESILKMGAHCGPDYFGRLDGYIDSGAHLKASGFKNDPADKKNVRAQKRSVAVAGALLDGDGNLKLDSKDAQAAIGNMLFHPDAMAHPMPSMTDTTLRTLEELKQPKAAEIVAGMTKPAEGGGAASLVADALGVTGPVTADQARTAVLATMFKSLDQGPVGSCFSTAPSRNLREGQPLVAMEKFAEIATKGTLTTSRGLPTPVVTEIPPGEDPIMRSLEYTLATALARQEMSTQNQTIQNRNMAGVDAIRGDIATALGKGEGEIGGDLFKILMAVRKGFKVQYDPTAALDEVSGDGSSSQGRHVLVDTVTGEVMTSREKYVNAVTPRVLAALNLDPDSDAAKALKPRIEADFVDAMVTTKPDGKVDRAPWKMVSGGQTGEAVEQLFGDTDYNVAAEDNYKKDASGNYLLDGQGNYVPLSDTREKQGARTLKVVEDLVASFGDKPDDMIVIRTVGIHGFNAMPNNPTLKPLIEGEGTMADRLKAAVADPGDRIAKAKMPVPQAQKHFDASVAATRALLQGWHDKAAPDKKAGYVERLTKFDAKAKLLRPTEEKTPSEVADLAVEMRNGVTTKPDRARDIAAASMIQDLGCPEIIIADTNWGDSETHTYIVLAPDPLSGQPVLWKKKDPPGTLSELPPKWIDASWASMIPKS